MLRVFIRFYLTLVVSFIGAIVLAGAIYGQVVANVSDRYLNDIFRATVSLVQTELADQPIERWNAKLETLSLSLPYPIKVEPLDTYRLSDSNREALTDGDIVMLTDSYLFLQRVPDTGYMLTLGPIDYLYFLREIQSFDYLLLGLAALFLGVPAFLWMRPLWRQLTHLKWVARQLGEGNLNARAKLPDDSGVAELGSAFNGMADNLQSLIQSRRELLNAVSHELRTPIARLRYRLAMLEEGVADDVRSAMDRDISSIDKMIEELLLYSRLEQARDVLQPQTLTLWPWLNSVVAQHAADFPDTDYQLTAVASTLHALTVDADPFYLERALSNLLRNAARYGQGRVEVCLGADERQCWIKVADNGPGIPEGERERVFEPFVRLDRSRDRRTGGYGLGLAIVQRIMGWHHGQASVATADLGGACFTLCWPRVHVVTSGHTSLTDEGESAA